MAQLENTPNSKITVTGIQTNSNCATAVAQLQNIVYELVTGVGWTQNCIIVEKCKNFEQVTFYLKQTKEKGWSKLDLLEKIEQNYFENHALAQNNFATTVPETLWCLSWYCSLSKQKSPRSGIYARTVERPNGCGNL